MAKTIFQTVLDIDNKVKQLKTHEKEFIKITLLFHGSEPMAAAERISEYLGVNYSSIFDLL
jgi:hypothetical protein